MTLIVKVFLDEKKKKEHLTVFTEKLVRQTFY